ncbi:MAG: DUF6133 family protein [Clostridia bacterium]
MKNLLKKAKVKTDELVIKTICFKQRAKFVLADNRGEGSVSQAITILTSVVIGALLLAGLYTLFENTIFPRLEEEIINIFDYQG